MVLGDEWYFLQILPEIVWKIVFQKLRDPTHYLKAINASEFIRKRLLPQRSTYLFGKVFKFLAQRYDKSDSKYFDDHGDLNGLIATSLQDVVWKYPGGFRLVCQQWNQAVQNHYQHHFAHFLSMQDMDLGNEGPSRRRRNFYRWENLNERLLQFFEHTHFSRHNIKPKNPLFRKVIRLHISSENINSAANFRIENFLKKFGDEIWYLYVEIVNTHASLAEFYLAFKAILDMLTNLKVLRVYYIKGQRQSWKAEHQLQNIIIRHPLKVFSDLKYLEVFPSLPAAILHELIQKNSHAYKFNIWPGGHKLFSCFLPNLRELFIIVRTKTDLRALSRKGKNWQLVTFQCMLTFRKSKCALDYVFKLVERNWSNTLQNFSIHIETKLSQSKGVMKLTTRSQLQLPLLRTFKLTINQKVSLDFLLQSQKNLEVIIIEQLNGSKRLHKEKIKKIINEQTLYFLAHEDELKNSNIWAFFPKLTKILVGSKAFYKPYV